MKHVSIFTLHILIIILWFINVFVWNLTIIYVMLPFLHEIAFFVLDYFHDTRDQKREELERKLDKLEKQLSQKVDIKKSDLLSKQNNESAHKEVKVTYKKNHKYAYSCKYCNACMDGVQCECPDLSTYTCNVFYRRSDDCPYWEEKA